MMITGMDIYLVTRLDNIIETNIVFSVLSFMGMITTSLLALTMVYDWSDIKKYFKLCAGVFIITSLIGLMVPTSKEAAAIYLIPKIVNNEQVQKVPENALKLLNTKMEQWINDMGKEDKK